ncbi:MAG: peptidase, partial [Mycobacterium sp.]
LRALYLAACGHGHPDIETAVRDALGVELPTVLSGWRQWGNS